MSYALNGGMMPGSRMDVRSLLRNLQVREAENERLSRQLGEAEVAASEMRRRLAELDDAAPAGLFIVTPEGSIRHVNPAGAAMLGVKPAALVGLSFGMLCGEESLPALTMLLRDTFQFVAAPVTVSCELRLNDPTGADRYVHVAGISNAAGSECRIAMVDISTLVAAHRRDAELAAVFDLLPDLYFRFDSNGRIVDYRASRLDELYIAPEAFIGRNVRDVLPADAAGAILEALQQAYLQGGIRTAEYRLPMPDGPQDYEVRVAPLESSGELIGVVRNITQRKHAEEALRNQHALLHTVINSSTDFIFAKDKELRTFLCNEAFAAALEKRPADLYGKTDIENGWPVELVNGNPQHGVRGYVQDDLDTLSGYAVRNPKEYIKVRGKLRVFDTVKLPLRDADSRLIGLLGISRDVTERALWEETLQETSQFNAQVIGSAQEGIIVYGLDLRYQVWNPFMEQLSGLSANDVLGRHPLDFFPFLKEQGVIAMLERVLAGHASETLEFPYRNPHTGKSGWCSDRSAPLRNAKGNLIGIISTVRDVTEQKNFEAARAEFEEHARLDAAGEMASIMAHELAQPLAATRIYLDGGLKMSEDFPQDMGRVREAMLLAQKQNQLASTIIARLREIMRNQADIRAPEDINALVRDALDLMEPDLRRYNIPVNVELSASLPTVGVTRIEIVQVLMNLIRNAVESMQSNTRDALLCVATCLENSREIRVSVSDTGLGLEVTEAEHLFNPFRTSKKEGFGLGLSICRSLVERHGGRIWADADCNVGAKFNFTLPLEAESE